MAANRLAGSGIREDLLSGCAGDLVLVVRPSCSRAALRCMIGTNLSRWTGVTCRRLSRRQDARLHVERLLNERPDGPIKTFTLRAIRSARRASTMVGF